MTAASRPFNLVDQARRDWIERAEVCADMVARLLAAHAGTARLADLGCGDTKLRQVLAARGLDIRYEGHDLLPQRDDVARLDLNTDPPPAGIDVAVMLGVGEYLPDLAGVLQRVGSASRWLIFSHVLKRDPPIPPARLAELGWINHLDAAALESRVDAAKLRILERRLTPDRRTLMLACTARGPDRPTPL
jgi:hypothetical protein